MSIPLASLLALPLPALLPLPSPLLFRGAPGLRLGLLGAALGVLLVPAGGDDNRDPLRRRETIVAGGSAEDLHAAHQEAVAEILTDDQIEIIEVHDALRAYLFVYHIENGDFAERFGF